MCCKIGAPTSFPTPAEAHGGAFFQKKMAKMGELFGCNPTIPKNTKTNIIFPVYPEKNNTGPVGACGAILAMYAEMNWAKSAQNQLNLISFKGFSSSGRPLSVVLVDCLGGDPAPEANQPLQKNNVGHLQGRGVEHTLGNGTSQTAHRGRGRGQRRRREGVDGGVEAAQRRPTGRRRRRGESASGSWHSSPSPP